MLPQHESTAQFLYVCLIVHCSTCSITHYMHFHSTRNHNGKYSVDAITHSHGQIIDSPVGLQNTFKRAWHVLDNIQSSAQYLFESQKLQQSPIHSRIHCSCFHTSPNGLCKITLTDIIRVVNETNTYSLRSLHIFGAKTFSVFKATIFSFNLQHTAILTLLISQSNVNNENKFLSSLFKTHT